MAETETIPLQLRCRVCLQEGIIPIFEDDVNTLQQYLSIVCNINVKANDGYPENLCVTCYDTLNGAIQLRQTAKKTEWELRLIQNAKKDTEQLEKREPTSSEILKNTQFQNYLDNHKISKENESGSYQQNDHIDQNENSFVTEENNLVNMDNSNISKENESGSYQQNDHIDQNENSFVTEENNLVNMDNSNISKENESGSYQQNDHIDQNENSFVTEENNSVNMDNSKISKENESGSYQQNDHIDQNENSFVAEENNLVNMDNSLYSYLPTNANTNLYTNLNVNQPLQENKETMVDPRKYLEKIPEDENEDIYRCLLCGIIIRSSNPVTHVKWHILKPQYVCDVCGKAFHRKYILNSHLKCHKDTLDYECDECPFKGRTKSALLSHVKVHSEILTKQCKICSRKFRNQSTLNYHVRRHGPPMYPCHMCDKSFYENNLLRDHIELRHLETKGPFPCSYCCILFKERKNLRVHEVKYHNSRKLKKGEQCAIYLKDPEEGEPMAVANEVTIIG